ncbi:MFS transporter [Synoicihabitans lomoniglobus]|uniref:MFS transporter n=1 Tax=Synoicihabitans lomoniglobus TaxID=2909285 RepID=A0AAF0A0U5_9BACT|nr:MFS transporter [Opitutaceae bacterium LMO-M01]WED64492.1 MFS transporter [Opitutaceae bacterium LMO-M01]
MDAPETISNRRHPWRWVPTLYFAQGIPYVAVMTLAVVMYKNFGISNTDIALYTSWLYLPWVIKPLWAPLIDLWRTKRWWITTLQFLIGTAFALIALTVSAPFFFQATLAVFWLLAFSSATHDIAADGFYLLALDKPRQAAFVGVRSTFYRIAMIAGQGGLVFLAGAWAERTGSMTQAWTGVFAVLAGFFGVMAIFHWRALPRPADDRTGAAATATSPWAGWWTVFAAFFRRPGIAVILGFLLFYRFAEAQLLKLATPFLLDERAVGGLGLSTKQVGVIYGTFGVVALTIGGLAGGYLVSRYGLRRLLWWMVGAMHVPNLVFVALAMTQPENSVMIGGALVLEQLGYGFGFTAYLVYMMMAAEGSHKTAHYALCTGFMALGMMLPGMGAGWLQEQLGYENFFIWIMISAIPSLGAAALIKIDDSFGQAKTA